MAPPLPGAVFVDIEGCLAPGKGREWDLGGLSFLATWIGAHPTVRFGIASGRPVPYVEAMAQALGLHRSATPCVCEGGAMLYVPATDRVERLAPALQLEELLAAVRSVPHRVEVGKVGCLTLYPEVSNEREVPAGIEALYRAVTAGVDVANYSIVRSAAAVDITSRGHDKASGVAAACARIGVPLTSVLCIGDAENDVPMLRSVGLAACPANASAAAAGAASLVALQPDVRGVLEILDRVFGPG